MNYYDLMAISLVFLVVCTMANFFAYIRRGQSAEEIADSYWEMESRFNSIAFLHWKFLRSKDMSAEDFINGVGAALNEDLD